MFEGDKSTNRLLRHVLRLLDDNGYVVEVQYLRDRAEMGLYVQATAGKDDQTWTVRVPVDEHEAPRYVAVCRLAEACGINLE